MFSDFIIGLAIILSSWIVHECGHYFPAKIFGWSPRFGASREGLYVRYRPTELNKRKIYFISFSGGLLQVIYVSTTSYILGQFSSNPSLIIITVFMLFYGLVEVLHRKKELTYMLDESW
jgi:hypothetical protein